MTIICYCKNCSVLLYVNADIKWKRGPVRLIFKMQVLNVVAIIYLLWIVTTRWTKSFQWTDTVFRINQINIATMKILPMRTVLQEWIYHLSTHPTILPGQSKRCLGTKKRYLLKRIHCSVVVLPQFKDSENLVSGCLLEHKANS